MAAAAFASAAAAAAAAVAATVSALCCPNGGCLRRRHVGILLWSSSYNGLLRFLTPRRGAGAIGSNGWSTTAWPWTFWAILVTTATKFGASQGRSTDGRPLRQQRTGLKALAVGRRQCRRSSKCTAHSVEQDTLSLACAQYCGGRGPGVGANGISSCITRDEEAILLLTRGVQATGAS